MCGFRENGTRVFCLICRGRRRERDTVFQRPSRTSWFVDDTSVNFRGGHEIQWGRRKIADVAVADGSGMRCFISRVAPFVLLMIFLWIFWWYMKNSGGEEEQLVTR